MNGRLHQKAPQRFLERNSLNRIGYLLGAWFVIDLKTCMQVSGGGEPKPIRTLNALNMPTTKCILCAN